ncbi:MAG TPA: DUF2203 domain-containing protein [Pyrinomonadaceae bacterium]|jgi:hypothetical protein|nr:DUF2203 domain-containing protein [Pyrinomonadaceae bacterium]
MRTFTVDEANELIPSVRKRLEIIQRLYSRLDSYRESAKAAASASEFGGGMEGGSQYVKSLYEIGKHTTDLHEMGVQLKDYSRGLIDFPSMRDGRVVLLCWQLGEPEQIEWWHEVEAGFAGRKPL